MEISAPGFRLTVAITLDEARRLVDALGTVDAEYGLDEAGRELLARMREVRDRLVAEQ